MIDSTISTQIFFKANIDIFVAFDKSSCLLQAHQAHLEENVQMNDYAIPSHLFGYTSTKE